MKVLLYARHGMFNWVRHLSSNLRFAKKTLIMSELRNQGDFSLADGFYRYLRRPDISQQALDKFGEPVCADIIERCRLLRNLDKNLALRMIGACWRALDDLLDSYQPDIFVGLRVDSYVLDILNRILAERNISYIGLWRAALVPNMIFFTARGEYIPLREPTEEEISKCVSELTDLKFQATSLKKDAEYNFFSFMKKRLYYLGRDYFTDLQRFIERDRYGYRYLTSSRYVNEYKSGFFDWKVTNYMREDWYSIFESTPLEKRIFIGLQVNPEATIDYYVKNLELINCQSVLNRLISVLGKSGKTIFIKDHPNMFGMRRRDFYQLLLSHENAVFVPYQYSSNILVKESQATFTWSGTIGLQAALAGRCSIVANPTYFYPGSFIQITSLADLDNLSDKINSFSPPPDLKETRIKIVQNILRTFVPGSLNWKEFDQKLPAALKQTEDLIVSLNTYLPKFIH